MTASDAFIRGLPKAELHMHLEGSIEPEMMFALAQRNQIPLRWPTPESLRAAYDFTSLQSFLDLYYEGCRVMTCARDYHDVTAAYLERARQDNVLRAELFIGPQNATERGIPLAAVMEGVLSAIQESTVSAGILIVAQRHRAEAEAIALLDAAMPWADSIAGFGLGGAERDHPPAKFARYFRAARDRGFHITAHAGEEGPAAYVREAVETIGVDRVDHGVACMDDPSLVRTLMDRKTPLTVCPLSNVRLRVVDRLENHPLRAMLHAGLNVSVNSDDPSYFGGYIDDNLLACRDALDLSASEIATLARNSFTAAFMPPAEIQRCLALVDGWCARHASAA